MSQAGSSVALRRFRLILWALVAVAAIGATIVFFTVPPKSTSTIGQGSYTLTDQDGAKVTEAVFKDHPSLLFFGYTHCPDVCPTTLADMSAWFETLGADAKDLKAYFVTVDPERDTPQVLKDYVAWVGPRLSALGGERGEVDKAIKAWGVVAEKVPGSGPDDYTMNHTASVFLLDSDGRFQSTIAYQEDQKTAVAKIRRLVGG
jgi:protein SCO1/2